MVAFNYVFQLEESEKGVSYLRKLELGFVVTGSILTIIFLIVVNFITGSHHIWFIYPALALLLGPIGIYCRQKKNNTLFSILTSLLLILFLIVENYRSTPEYPWFLFSVAPLIAWPTLVYLGNQSKKMTVAVIGSAIIILYYLILNVLLSPGYPWVMFPAFAVLWWPLTLYHVKRKSYFKFSIYASLLISIFFISVNVISSPHVIWAVYPIFVVLWWPLSMYYFVYKRKLEL